MTEERSAIYRGTVVHTRLRPRQHKLRYTVAAFLLELDQLASDLGRVRLMSVDRANLFSFRNGDHGEGGAESALDYARRALSVAGLGSAGARVRLLCYPRMFGYTFNPLSVYYCYNAGGSLEALIYEVNNTWHERVSYVVPAGSPRDGVFAHGCGKAMAVSPFTANDGRYRFQIKPPDEDLILGIRFSDATGPVLKTHFRARAAPLTDGALATILLCYPAMTAKVIGAIHWEALKLYLKGLPIIPRRKSAPHAIVSAR